MDGSICSFTNGAAISTQTSSNGPPEKNDPRFWNRLYRNLGGLEVQDVTERAGVRRYTLRLRGRCCGLR